MSSQDINAGEGDKPIRMPLKKSRDTFVLDKCLARGCALIEASDDRPHDSSCVEMRDVFRILSH
jgi:hypothetical protein